MTLILFDTLSNTDKAFSPLEAGRVKLYVCGPTPYDDAHIGHARPCILYDVLVRHLRTQGFAVTYVRNVADVDDKIIKRAEENHETPFALSERMFRSYSEDMTRLGNLRPDHEPKVSENIPEIVALIERLIEGGHAYPADGDVYFHVASFPDYGKLSHRDLTQLEAGASERTDEAEALRKRHPYDFALWKGAKPGEPSWESPWGPGRPGWHIECSAMSMRYLGESFDIHGGGLDLVFPHHENEIAQSECASGKCLASHWVHNGFVQVNKEKMSKSLGNFFRLREAFAVVEPEAVRYALLSVHYRSPFNLDIELDDRGALVAFPQFREAESRLLYLYGTRERFEAFPVGRVRAESPKKVPAELGEFATRVAIALDGDLNTSQALAHVAAFLKAANEALDVGLAKGGSLPEEVRGLVASGFATLRDVLGLGADDPSAFLERVRDRRAAQLGITPTWVDEQLVLRADARKNRDFARADELRGILADKGIEILDTPERTSWRLR